MAIAATTDLFAKCTPAYGLGSNVCGGLTTMNISATTLNDLTSIYQDPNGKFRILGALIESDFMGRACQIRQNSLYDYLMATARSWGTGKINTNKRNGMLDVVPFVEMGRKGFINNNYWNVRNGATNGNPSGVKSPNLTATYQWSAQVSSQTGIPADLRWFPLKMELYVSGVSNGGSMVRTQYTIVDANYNPGDLFVTVYCQTRNTASYLAGAKVSDVVSGIASRGVPNVNDYEAYCAQVPGLNTNQRAFYWIQDTRWSICNDEMTEKYLDELRKNNPMFAEFGDVPSVELNKQVLEDFQRRHVNSFLFNKPLPNQTPSAWDQLEVINGLDGTNISNYLYLPGVQGRQVARRANAVGVYEQLAECGRVYDLQGQPLNLPELFQNIYTMHRVREDNQIEASIIECVTDTTFALTFRQGMFRYLQSRFEGAFRVTADYKDFTEDKESPMGFKFSDYKLDYPVGVTLRIVTHRAFDDLVSAHRAHPDGSLETAGRFLLFLDWGKSVYQAVIQSNSVQLQTGDLKVLASVNADAFCRMNVPQKKIKSTSMKYTNVVECPAGCLWIEGIPNIVPEHRATVGNTGDLAGALP
jgi:hypothetical protein